MTRDEIIAMVARASRRRADAVQGHLTLASLGLSASLSLSVLRSRLEAGSARSLPPLEKFLTIDALCALVTGEQASGEPAAQSAPMPEPAPAPLPAEAQPLAIDPANVAVGLDIQEIESLPECSDYRGDPFYVGHFLPAEIATAMLRPDPRATFCGLFCAKEAAKKSHPALLGLRMTQLQVSHDPDGRPRLDLAPGVSLPNRFSFRISISHMGRMAAATCLTMWSAA